MGFVVQYLRFSVGFQILSDAATTTLTRVTKWFVGRQRRVCLTSDKSKHGAISKMRLDELSSDRPVGNGNAERHFLGAFWSLR